MSLREEMHSLVEGIVSASQTRRAALSSSSQLVTRQRAEGRQRVHQLHQAHGRMSRELRAGLSKARLGLVKEETHRRPGVHDRIGEIASDRGSAQREWRNMAATPREKRVPEDKPLSSGQGQEGTHRRRQGGKA